MPNQKNTPIGYTATVNPLPADFVFETKKNGECFRVCEDGKIYINGELCGTNKDAYKKFVKMLSSFEHRCDMCSHKNRSEYVEEKIARKFW